MSTTRSPREWLQHVAEPSVLQDLQRLDQLARHRRPTLQALEEQHVSIARARERQVNVLQQHYESLIPELQAQLVSDTAPLSIDETLVTAARAYFAKETGRAAENDIQVRAYLQQLLEQRDDLLLRPSSVDDATLQTWIEAVPEKGLSTDVVKEDNAPVDSSKLAQRLQQAHDDLKQAQTLLEETRQQRQAVETECARLAADLETRLSALTESQCTIKW